MPTSTGRFAGSSVLVTGGAHGIGRACATRLAAEGAWVAVADLDELAAAEVVGDLSGGPHLAVPLDVTRRESVEAAVSAAAASLDGIDVLINVAGGDTQHSGFEETEDAVWSHLYELNLMGVVRCCQAALPHLRRSGRGSAIVTVSSVNALTALGSEPYSAAKAGLGSLTLNLARTFGPEGIRVNAVAPGTIRTRVWAGQEGGAAHLLPLYPLGRLGEPEDVAAAVAFLASDDAAWITGHTLPVDGGLLTHR